MNTRKHYDALVVGGGPAGLTGALYLARFRRSVLVVDEGCSRATRIPRSHNMPGYPDGISGSALVGAIREQAARYGVDFAVGRVEALEHGPDGFLARWTGGEARARLALLATGASDVEPAIPYVQEAVRCGALRYCPVCDGYEVIDQRVGVLTDGSGGIKEALYLRHFTSQLTVFPVSPEVSFSDEECRRLQEAGITLAPAPASGVRLWNGKVKVGHGESESECDSLYSALGMRVHSELAAGAERDKEGYLVTDRRQKTSIAGLYAAGDVSLGLNQISVAMGEAAIAASAMHLALGTPA